jgi:glycosyltransferase involved in cell wall biosynthesis
MRILYDGSIYATQAAGGINRYFANLIKRLPENYIPILTAYQAREVNYPSHPNLKVFGCRRFRPDRLFFMFSKYYFRYVTSVNDFDVAHPTYYSLLTRRELSEYRCPTVITVHDMIHELFPATMDPTGSRAEEKRRAVTEASAVICVSENTKRDLLERYALPPEKVHVIHHASQISESLSHGAEPVPERSYFLYVGTRHHYKNFDALLSSFAKIVAARYQAVLCVVGPPFDPSEAKAIADLKLTANVEHYGYVSDEHLAKLYRCSTAFVYPSLYEGFGLPLIEAMSCGTAVIAANRASIPEVLGDTGILFNPDAMDELTDALFLLLDNAAERARQVESGRRRATHFCWDTTVARTLEVYRSIAI